MFSVPWRIAAIALAALAPLWGTAPPADAATSPVRATRLPNCNYNGGVAPCFESTRANGIQVKMIFDNLNPEPSNAPTRNFYVTAVQTRTPQGLVPFLHDHVIGQDRPQTRADNRENDSIRYHGFFVL